MSDIPSGLRTDAPPTDGSQIVAWAIDNWMVSRDGDARPRWVIAQWAEDYRGGAPYWKWSTPGRSTSVTILGWLPLPALDCGGLSATGRTGS